MHYFAFKTHLRGDSPHVQNVIAKYAIFQIEIATYSVQFKPDPELV